MAKSTSTTRRTSADGDPDAPGPAPAAPAPPPAPDEADQAPRPPEMMGPAIPVNTIWWKKDAAPQLPGLTSGGWSRTEAWPQMKHQPDFHIYFLPRIRMFWFYYLGPAQRTDRGTEGSRERYVPVESHVTWTPWRGDEDIPAGAWRRMQLQQSAAAS